MTETTNYKGYGIWVRQTRIGCHEPHVFFCRIYKGEIKVGTHVHIIEFKDESEQVLQDAKDWIDNNG